jgi:hypothetical protein
MSEKRERDLWEVLGIILIAAGVGVWGVYGVLRFGKGMDVAARQFLPYHLAGVVPGMILKRHRFLRRMVERLLS